MLKSLFYSCVVIAACAAPVIAHADDFTGESIVVSATRLPTPVDEVASSVTLITAADIEAQQQRTLPEVLEDVPGLNIVQTGGVGGQTSIFMRGTNSNQTKVLLDGIDISDPSTPNDAADVGKLMTNDIARVEVLRGPQSGLYGSDAIGGVINIITKSGEGPATFTASLEGGSFDSFNEQAGLSGSQGDFHYVASLDHIHSGATPVTPLDFLNPGETRNDDYYDGIMASTKLGYDVVSNFDLGLVGHYDTSLEHITGDASNPVTFASFPSPIQSRIDTLQYDTRATAHLVLWEGRFDQTLGLAYSSNATSDADPNFGYSLASGSRVKLDWQGNVGLVEGQTLVLGAETTRDAIHMPLSAGITTNAGFIELQSALGAFNNSLNIRYDANGRFGDKVTYRVAPTYLIAETGTRLKASLGTGFKAPSLEDLFQSLPSFGFFANPNLKPETSLGYDVGVEQSFWADALKAGVTWFQNDIKNLITDNAAFTTDINIGKARTQGVESFIAWRALDTLSFRADYTYTNAEDDVAHTELLRRPANKVSLNADWRPIDNLSLVATMLYTGPQADIGRESGLDLALPGYTLVNFAASYRLDNNFTLFGRVDNSLDQHYQSPDGFLRPGIGAYAGIKVSL
jgi:vitamin B12 transporter